MSAHAIQLVNDVPHASHEELQALRMLFLVSTPVIAAHVQVTALFYSGSYLAGVQELVSKVEDIELLSFQAAGQPVQDFDTSGLPTWPRVLQIICTNDAGICHAPEHIMY